MRRAWSAANASLIAALAACSDPVIQMRLALPDPAATGDPDLSCVGAVRISVIGNNPDDVRAGGPPATCFDLPAPMPRLSDIAAALAGKFTFDVPPDGLAGVELTGFSGRCSDPGTSYESVFYGGAPNVDGGTLVIPLVLGVGCGTQQSYQVNAIDLTALYQPAGPSCAPPGDPVKLFAGVIRPRMLGQNAPETMFEYGADSVEPVNGAGKLVSYRPTDGDACVALGYRGAASGGVTCIRPPAQAHGLCSMANDVEIVSVPAGPLVFDAGLLAAYAYPLIGAVWDANARQPITNATVELADPNQGKVVYIDIGLESGGGPPRLRKMAPIPGATSTAPGGGFMLYLRGKATDLIVRASGYGTQTLRVATAPDQLATMIVPLTRSSPGGAIPVAGSARR